MNNQPKLTAEQLQAHPEVAMLLSLLGMMFLALIIGFFAVWIYYFSKVSRGEKVLQPLPWKPRAWGFIDIAIIGLSVVVSQVAAISVWAAATNVKLTPEMKMEIPLSAMAMVSGSYLVVMVLATLCIAALRQVSLAHIGFDFRNLPQQIGLGLCTAAATIPIVYLVMSVASVGLKEEYDHPLIRTLTKDGSLAVYAMGFFSAAIVAPLTEEFLFRVILQGWLQSLPASLSRFKWLFGFVENGENELGDDEPAGFAESQVTAMPFHDSSTPQPDSRLADQLLVSPGDANSLSTDASTSSVDLPIATTGSSQATSQSAPIWPIFVSSTLFGLAHFEYGVSFIPLTLLGIVLGWLYRLRQSIWPCVIVHFTLNFIAMVGLAIQVLSKQIAG